MQLHWMGFVIRWMYYYVKHCKNVPIRSDISYNETTPTRIQSASLAVTIGYNIDHFGVEQAGYIL